MSGSGATGASGPAGTLRYGFNEYDALLADDLAATPPAFYNSSVVAFDFDDGTAAASHFGLFGTAGEAMAASLDSAGPSVAFQAGAWRIVGIHFAIEDTLGTGLGAIGYGVLAGNHAGWIESVTAVPEPASALLLGAGLLGVAGAARRRC